MQRVIGSSPWSWIDNLKALAVLAQTEVRAAVVLSATSPTSTCPVQSLRSGRKQRGRQCS